MPHRRGATGHRQPSRSSSATRLGPNLQFTQSQHKGETSSRGAQHPTRLSSAQHIASREHVSAYAGKQQRSQASRKPSQPTTNKSKPGFTLSQGSHSDEESSNSSSEVDDTHIYDENEAEDDDEWVSSESGAQTPNSNEGSEASERERRDREMDRRRDEALKRLLSSGEVPQPGAGRQAQQGSGPVTAKPPPVVDDATAATPQARNHLSQPPKHQHHHQQEAQPRAAHVPRVDTARPEELKSRASSAAARDRAPAPTAGNQMPPPAVPAAALAKRQATNGSVSTQAPAAAAAQTQQPASRSNGAPGSKLTIQTTAPTPPSNARSLAPTSQPPSQTNSHPNSPRPRESSRRQPTSRPSSGYNSRHSSGDVSQHSHGHHQHQQPLRPHPLIRGHSFGLGPSGSGKSTPLSGGPAGAFDSAPHTPKHAPLPSQLLPLTVIQDSAGMLSGSPEDDRSGFGRHTHYISSSPTGSVKTVLTSPGSPDRPRGSGGTGGRRTSVSSVHSSMTMPIQGSTWSLPGGGGSGSGLDRKRTTSTLSHSSSTAALSQLVSSGLSSSTTLNPNSPYPTALSTLSHLPSVTRPPSPQAISFFPPMNTQVKNEIEGIHPLLPPPYIGNHLAVLARRNPVWESWERVGRAKREMRSY